MRTIFIGTLLMTAVVFGVFYARETSKTRQAQLAAEGLRQKLNAQETELARQKKQTAGLRNRLEENRQETPAETDEATRTRPDPAPDAPAPPTNGKASSPFSAMADMLKNPAMKAVIREQQKAVISASIDKDFAPLFSALQLTSDQAAALKEMMLNKALNGTESGVALMSGDLDAAQRTELIRQSKEQSDASDAQIKQFLGDDNYAQFQAYEQSQGQRKVVGDFQNQLAAGPSALTDDQAQGLVQSMIQARRNFTFTHDGLNPSGEDPAVGLSLERIDQRLQEQAQLDQEYLTRAQTILSGDQWAVFQKFLTDQEAGQKAFLQMTAKMFGSGGGGH